MAAPAYWERLTRDPGFGSDLLSQEPETPSLILGTDPRKTRLYWPDRDGTDSKFVNSLVRFVDGVDKAIGSNFSLITGNDGGLVFENVFERIEVARQKEQFYKMLGRFDKLPASHFVLPEMGAFAIGVTLSEMGVLDDKLHLVPIGGSLGAETGGAKVKGRLPKELLDPRNRKAFADDVGDSGNTLVVYLTEVGDTPGGEGTVYSHLINLHDEIEALRKARVPYSDQRYDDIYSEVVKYLPGKNVVYAPLYSKNPTFKEALERQVEMKSYSEWAKAQREALQAMIPVGEHLWIIGGKGGDKYGFLDSGMEGRRVLEVVRGIDSSTSKTLSEIGLGATKLRMGGGIEGLIALHPPQEPSYVDLTGHLLASFMQQNSGRS